MSSTDATGRASRWFRVVFVLLWMGATVFLVVIVVRSGPAEDEVELQSGFTSVQRQTLSSTESFSGTVQFDTPIAVARGATSGISGAGGGGPSGPTSQIVEERVTWIVEPGVEVDNGDVLYEVNDQPVVLLTGSVPSYRTLRPGDVGVDVIVVQSALVQLGYDPDGLVEIDGEFGALTEDMVEA